MIRLRKFAPIAVALLVGLCSIGSSVAEDCCVTIAIPNAPSIRIASVAGSAVPATPTGNADVTLPGNVVNPVTVNFETANVPTGNTIKLRVVPAAA